MYRLCVTTWIDAPIDRCFDLARSVEAHLQSARGTGERVVAGPTSGLLCLGDEITWEGKHLGVTQQLSGRITKFEPHSHFQDTMTRGAFRSLKHDHFFETQGAATLMTDVVTFEAPFGPIGWVVERLLIAGHLRRFLTTRGLALKDMAEQ